MRTWRGPQAAAAMVIVGLALSGCEPPPPPVPMATDGPGQVVIKVPGMT